MFSWAWFHFGSHFLALFVNLGAISCFGIWLLISSLSVALVNWLQVPVVVIDSRSLSTNWLLGRCSGHFLTRCGACRLCPIPRRYYIWREGTILAVSFSIRPLNLPLMQLALTSQQFSLILLLEVVRIKLCWILLSLILLLFLLGLYEFLSTF